MDLNVLQILKLRCDYPISPHAYHSLNVLCSCVYDRVCMHASLQ